MGKGGSIIGAMMDRREFIKVTVAGSAFLIALPVDLGKIFASDKPATPIPAREDLLAIIRSGMAEGVDWCDVFLEHSERTSLNLVESKVEAIEYGIDFGGGVRVISRGRTGYAYADSWEMDELREAAKLATKIFHGGRAGGVAEVREAKPRGIVTYMIPPNEVSMHEKAELVIYGDSIARKYDPAIVQVRISLTDEMRQTVLASSEGQYVEQVQPLVWLSISVVARRDSKMAQGMVRRSWRAGFERIGREVVEEAAKEAARQAIVMLDARDAPKGEIPVVIGSGGGVVIHEAVGHGLEGDGVERGTSFYRGLAGTMVGSSKVTIVDDATIPSMRGSYDYDDEGFGSQRNLLIENGVLKGYLFDILTAEKMGRRSTGNGRRQSYRYYPLVRMSNTFLDAGDLDPSEIIEATKSGLYARFLGGGEVDTSTGDFTFGVREAYLIEDGKTTSPVRGATLIGNGPEILKRIDLVGNDLEFWPGTCGKGQWVPITSGSPTFRISKINVGGGGM
ncbi:MAG: TldD/PmbA family protein [bacterium]